MHGDGDVHSCATSTLECQADQVPKESGTQG
jgi:hypothetical protein